MFQPLFNISIFHTYFEDSSGYALLLKPNTNTQQLMQRFGMKWALNEHKYTLYASMEGSKKDFLEYLGTVVPQNQHHSFLFDIEIDDTSFSGYTDLSLDEIEFYTYDTNSELNEYEGNRTVLIPTKAPSDTPSIFGQIEIYFDALHDEDDEVPSYEIRFQARKTIWKYYIINDSNLDLPNPVIQNQDGFKFEGPIAATLPNGQTALMFSSGNTEFQLKNTPQQILNLNTTKLDSSQSESSNSRPKVVLSGLPSPNPLQFEILEQQGNKRVVSPMYIYV